jgi:hypothetical protein
VAVLALISILNGAMKPVVPTQEETFAIPAVVVGLLEAMLLVIAEGLRAGEVHLQSAPSTASAG